MTDELLSGFHAVLAALKQHGAVDEIWLDEERHDPRVKELLQAAKQAKVKVHRVPRAKLDRLSGSDLHHQGVMARLQATPQRQEKELPDFLDALEEPPFLLLLDGVQDPHNLGACLRSAAAAGVHAVLLPRDRSAPITATTRRAASGAAETLPVFRVTNLARVMDSLRQRGIWIIGAAGDADTVLYEADLQGPVALVLGGEGKGLRRLTREHCDVLVKIPMAGAMESLNVSVATGVLLFEAARQRRGHDGD